MGFAFAYCFPSKFDILDKPDSKLNKEKEHQRALFTRSLLAAFKYKTLAILKLRSEIRSHKSLITVSISCLTKKVSL